MAAITIDSMYLKKIELQGFKSFARQSTLEFITPITAIVGPNGSGKSNIAEAVRFVLGEQSIKSLRGKRGEDLIFNGTHTLPRQNRASVTIIFDNSKRIFNVDFDEVSIKRTVYRDSTSDYSVNGSKVRLKDILEILSAVHIGASSHHIISQGESDRILLASMKERRSMVEDALGLRIHHYKKMESVRKLDKTNENLLQIKALKNEVEPRLRFLEKQVVKIKHAERLREELKNLYTVYFAREQRYLHEQKQNIETEKRGPEQELKKIERIIKNLEEKLHASRAEKDAAIRAHDLEERMKRAGERKEELSRMYGKIEGTIEYEERKLEEENKKSIERKEALIPISSIQELQDSLALYGERAEKEQDIRSLKGILSDMRERVVLFCSMFLSKDTLSASSISLLKTSLEKMRAEKEKNARDIALVKNEEIELARARAELQKNTEQEHGKEREYERELFTLQNRKTELNTRMELWKFKEEQYASSKASCDSFLKEARALVGVIPYESEKIKEMHEERAVQEGRRRSIERIKIKLEEIGIGGDEILKEYKEVKERDEFLTNEIADLEKSAHTLKGLIKDLEEKINQQFKDGIQKINKRFQELFVLMFGGGKASLRVIVPVFRKTKKELRETQMKDEISETEEGYDDIDREEEEGIEIEISLPRKKIKGLVMLSGGERALTSIALIFAMTQVNPPPFLILDETDAALDEVNSRKYGDMLKVLAKETELILITHNRETMAHADILYGVTAIDGVSHLLSVKFDEAKEFAQV